MKFFLTFLIFFSLFLTGCNTTSQLSKKQDEIATKIGENQIAQTKKAAGAVIATKTILEKSPQTDIYTESALETINFAGSALPDIGIEERQKWQEIGTNMVLNGGSESNWLQTETAELAKLQKERENLIKEKEQVNKNLIAAYQKIEQEQKDQIRKAEDKTKLLSKLSMYFAWAAVAVIIGSAVLGYFFGMKLALNGIIAGAFFGLASYLVILPIFSYIAAGTAIVMIGGTVYYIWGALKYKKPLERTVNKIESLEKSGNARARDAAKIVKDEVGNSFGSKKEEIKHKKIIQEVKK
jgi:hypothetical protein